MARKIIFIIPVILVAFTNNSYSQKLLNQYDEAAIEFKKLVKETSKQLEADNLNIEQILQQVKSAENIKKDASLSSTVSIKKAAFQHEENKTTLKGLLHNYYEPKTNQIIKNFLLYLDSDISKAKDEYSTLVEYNNTINWENPKPTKQLTKLSNLLNESEQIFNRISDIEKDTNLTSSKSQIESLDKQITAYENELGKKSNSFQLMLRDIKCDYNSQLISLLKSGNISSIDNTKPLTKIERIEQYNKSGFPPTISETDKIEKILNLKFPNSICNDSILFSEAVKSYEHNKQSKPINTEELPNDSFSDEKLKKELYSAFANEYFSDEEWNSYDIQDIILTSNSKWKISPASSYSSTQLKSLEADVFVKSIPTERCYLLSNVGFNQKFNSYTGSVSVINITVPDSYKEFNCNIENPYALSENKQQIIECKAKGNILQCLSDMNNFISNIDNSNREKYYKMATKSFHYSSYYTNEYNNNLSTDVLNKIKEYLTEIEQMLPELYARTTQDEFIMRRTLWITLTKKQVERLGSPCQY